jgi:hypothetical protein
MKTHVRVFKSFTGRWMWRCPECFVSVRSGNIEGGNFHTWDFAYASARYHANAYHGRVSFRIDRERK